MPIIIDDGSALEYLKNEFNKDPNKFINSSDIDDKSALDIVSTNMSELANLLRECLLESMGSLVSFNSAYGYESLSREIAGFAVGEPRFEDDLYTTVDMWSQSSTYRPSLMESTFGGVDNILLLFDTGYDAPNACMVVGSWHGDMVSGKTYRPSTGFLQEGVNKFNSTYGIAYNARAIMM